MSSVIWIRNTLILAGIGAGALIAVQSALKTPPAPPQAPADASRAVILNTARAAPAPVAMLARPLSLDSAFGRSELGGVRVFGAPADPLFELDIERRYDRIVLGLPPMPSVDGRPIRAEDEVIAGEDERPARPARVSDERLADLPQGARQSADSGRVELQEGNKLMHEGLAILRGDKEGTTLDEPDRLLSRAARHFEAARDQLRAALAFAPEHRALLEMLQEAKTNLYTCMKHSRKR